MTRLLTILLLLLSAQSFAQQSPQYSQYIRNQYMINPGATGVYDHVDLALGGRLQWAGFEGAPMTSYLYFSAPVEKLRGASMKRTYGKVKRNNRQVQHPVMRVGKLSHAFGAHLLADQYGPFRQYKAMGTYAIHLPITRDYAFSFGTNVGIANRSFLSDKAQVLSMLANTGMYDATYGTYTSDQRGQNTLEVEAGLYFHGKGAFAGFSANQLTGDLVKFGNKTVNFDPKIHYFLTGGYEFNIGRSMTMTPAVLIKYVTPAPVSIEGTIQFDYLQRFWFGASYRHKDAIVVMLGATISDQLRVGYSFDLSTSRLINYSSGSHEVVIGLMFGRSGGGASAKF